MKINSADLSLWEEMRRPWHLDVLLTVALLTLLTAGLCWGAIVERGTSSSADTGSPLANTLSFAHNSGTGVEPDCVTWVGTTVRTTAPVTSVTYGGQAMTVVVVRLGTGLRCEIWMLLDPPDGSNTVLVERIGSSMRMVAGAVTVCGVDQGTPFREPAEHFSGTTTNVSHAVTSGTGEVVLAVIANENSANGVTTGIGQTEEWNNQTSNATSGNNVVGVGSTEPGAGTVTIQYNQGVSEDYALCTVSMRPSGVIGPGDLAEGLQPILQ